MSRMSRGETDSRFSSASAVRASSNVRTPRAESTDANKDGYPAFLNS